jgi:hypothetical protein
MACTWYCDRDGALGSWGAALLEPYSDKPDEYGTMRSPEEVWEPLIDEFVSNVSLLASESNLSRLTSDFARPGMASSE